MPRRADTIYIPKPVCDYGHVRTSRNTGWVRYKVHGKVYLYARCKACMTKRQQGYYQHRKKRKAKQDDCARSLLPVVGGHVAELPGERHPDEGAQSPLVQVRP